MWKRPKIILWTHNNVLEKQNFFLKCYQTCQKMIIIDWSSWLSRSGFGLTHNLSPIVLLPPKRQNGRIKTDVTNQGFKNGIHSLVSNGSRKGDATKRCCVGTWQCCKLQKPYQCNLLLKRPARITTCTCLVNTLTKPTRL